jgi:hypothetical protein
VADTPERKADLDKDGIVLEDAGKVELDKDGISLHDEDEASPNKSVQAQEPKQESQAEAVPKRGIPFPSWIPWPSRLPWKRPEEVTKPVLISGSAGLAMVFLISGFAVHHAFSHKHIQPTKISQPKQELVVDSDGSMVLDPFMVFSDIHGSKDAGVIIAQVGLKVEPDAVPNIASRLFDIRSIISKRLASAANVYSESEILQMLSKDLEDFQIGSVSFIHYQVK